MLIYLKLFHFIVKSELDIGSNTLAIKTYIQYSFEITILNGKSYLLEKIKLH